MPGLKILAAGRLCDKPEWVEAAFKSTFEQIKANDAVIVETIIAMAMHMHIDVVAEGVENRQTLLSLKRMGCRRFQGYYFGHPLPFDQLQKGGEAQQDIA